MYIDLHLFRRMGLSKYFAASPRFASIYAFHSGFLLNSKTAETLSEITSLTHTRESLDMNEDGQKIGQSFVLSNIK